MAMLFMDTLLKVENILPKTVARPCFSNPGWRAVFSTAPCTAFVIRRSQLERCGPNACAAYALLFRSFLNLRFISGAVKRLGPSVTIICRNIHARH
jgi:hypothetical protein